MFIMIFQILGGAGLLLYGIEVMKDSLELTTQGVGQKLLTAAAKNRFMAILAGFGVTAINQKSSATTIMVIGLVNAGMLSLAQATGVIMGANIGTTITAQLLAFRLEYFAPAIVGVAAIIWRMAKTKRMEYFAGIFLGFGMMFIGMFFMEMGIKTLIGYEEARQLLIADYSQNAHHFLIALAVGFIVTAIVHSSSLMTGVLIAFAAQGMLVPGTLLPLLLGINLGKSMPALSFGRGLTRSARRAAVIHMLFNLTGVIVIGLFLRQPFLNLAEVIAPDNLPRQIAHLHTLFNAGTALLLIPFIGLLAKVSDIIVPAAGEVEERKSALDVRMLATPGLALAQTYNEISRLTKLAAEAFRLSFKSVQAADQRDEIWEIEENLLKKQKEIEIYLVKLAQNKLSANQRKNLNLMLGVSSDIERIADLSIDIADLARYSKEHTIHYTEAAISDMTEFYDCIKRTFDGVIKAMETKDIDGVNEILSSETSIRTMEAELRERHIARLSQGSCHPGSGVMYIDLINNMAHVADHIKKIGYFVIEVSKY